MTRRLAVARVLLSHGVRRYPEAVTQLDHALQCAALARRDCAADEVVLAALLHDIGHLTPGASERLAPGEGPQRHHGQWGALLVRPFVPERVTWLIEHHVVAKRYLCTVDRRYADRLSPASARSLVAQAVPLSLGERVRLEAEPRGCWARSAGAHRIMHRRCGVGVIRPLPKVYRTVIVP